MTVLLIAACLLFAIMLCLAKAEPQTSRLRHHRLLNQERELARRNSNR